MEKKRGGTNKKIIEDISQAEAGLLRHTELIKEEKEQKIYAKHRSTH